MKLRTAIFVYLGTKLQVKSYSIDSSYFLFARVFPILFVSVLHWNVRLIKFHISLLRFPFLETLTECQTIK